MYLMVNITGKNGKNEDIISKNVVQYYIYYNYVNWYRFITKNLIHWDLLKFILRGC